MPISTTKALLLAIALAGGAPLIGSAPAAAQGSGRSSMEQCVARVLQRLARSQAPATAVGPAVTADCDGPLRQAIAAAIRSGEAGNCTVESCLAIARERAAQEATQAYAQQVRR